MGSFANTLFTILLGWLRGAVSAVWSAFTSEKGNSFLNWIGSHWILIAVILCVIGLAADLCVYLLRWKPFEVWRSFLFRNRNAEEDEGEREEKTVPERRRIPERPRRVISRPERERPEGSEAAGYSAPKDAAGRRIQDEEPDFSQWKEEPEEAAPRYQDREEQPALVTGAGYVVPADSPYRRPAENENNPYSSREEQPERRYRRTAGRDSGTGRRQAEEPERIYRRTAERNIGPYYAVPPEAEMPVSNGRTDEPAGEGTRQNNDPVNRSPVSREEYREYGRTQEEPAPVVMKKRRRISVSDLFADPEEELKQIDAPQDIIDRNKAYREPVYPRGWKRNEENEE